MIGAIIGNICGSKYECNSITNLEYDLNTTGLTITDDTVLTNAVGKWMIYIKQNKISFKEQEKELKEKLIEYILNSIKNNPTVFQYEMGFQNWINSEEHKPYNSYGNGSAIRVSPIVFLSDSVEEVMELSRISAEITHNHEEGIKGAQAIALSIYYARENKTKEFIKEEIEKKFNYDLNRKYKDIQKNYKLEVSCEKSVPESIICFLESEDIETAIRNAINMKGDTDTMAAMAGGIAEAYYKDINDDLIDLSTKYIQDNISKTLIEFYELYEPYYRKNKLKIR